MSLKYGHQHVKLTNSFETVYSNYLKDCQKTSRHKKKNKQEKHHHEMRKDETTSQVVADGSEASSPL